MNRPRCIRLGHRRPCVLTAGLIVIVTAAGIADDAARPAADNGPRLKRIVLYPAEITLRSSRAQSQLVVTGHFTGGEVRDLTAEAEFRTTDPAVATPAESRVVARGDGSATVEVRVGPHTATASVRVANAAAPDPVRFGTEVLAILTRQGCNSGSCHGSPEGKAGFSLSLMAFAPQRDAEMLIHGGLGRRVNPIEPQESLLLKKPLLRVSHVGGKRLHTDDIAYRILHDWIAEGARGDTDGAPECTGIRIHPRESRLLRLPAARQQLCVQAEFSDGTVRDVTPLATYSTSDEDVLSGDRSGLVRGHERGVGAVMVRYLSHVEAVDFTIVEDIEGFEWNSPPENNYIDTLVHAKLRQLQYLPSEPCDDATFVRRVYLDLTGLLPRVEQARAFLADPAPDKRSRLIDELLESVESARFWATKTADLMRVNKQKLTDGRAELFSAWIRDSWRENRPFDEFAHALLTASGDTKAHAPANYFSAIPTNEDVTETTAQLFMGSRINCAKCHNHPYENWTQDDYYRIAAVFVRTENDKGTIVLKDKGEATNPRTGDTMRPWGMEQAKRQAPLPDDRRQPFVDWLTDPDNPYFAPVEVNRVWAHLMGRGIVEPVDDFRSSNPPCNRELLDALAADFVENGYDRRHIIRTICNSQTYQRSSATNSFNVDDTKQFSHYLPRMLTAEQLHDAIGFATRTLPPTQSIEGELAASREDLADRLARLPQDRVEWETSLTERLTEIDCWQGTWRYTGAFKAKTFEEAVSNTYGPEQDLDFSFTRTYEEGKIKWDKRPDWVDGEIHLLIEPRPGPFFLARKIYTTRPGRAEMTFSGNGSVKAWLNGEVVYDCPDNRPLQKDEHRLEADLREGENTLLMKFANGGGLWGVYYKLVSFAGKPPSVLQVELTDEQSLLATVRSHEINGSGTIDIRVDVAELIIVPRERRTGEQEQELVRLQETTNGPISALKDRVARLTDWLDYQTQRTYPAQNQFLEAFGQPMRESPCACERVEEPSIDQALQLLNGDLVRQRTADGARTYACIDDPRELIDAIYFTALMRSPRQPEIDVALRYLEAHSDRAAAVHDLLWAVINTREFVFQH